jgi:hypothetical protein
MIASPTYAGMHANPVTFRLDTLVAYRMQSLSFFLVLTLVLGLFIKWIWNALAKDFPRLPKLTYFKALAFVLLWGLLLALIMSMTTGARELLTPGAWDPTAPPSLLIPDKMRQTRIHPTPPWRPYG